MPKLLRLAPALLIAGCMTAPAPGPAPAPPPGMCRGDGLGAFAGREATAATGDQILRESGARVLRWVQPGMMVTMEFSAERVTVWLAANNRIERASCG